MSSPEPLVSFSAYPWVGQGPPPRVVWHWTQVARLACLMFLAAQLAGGVVRWILDMVGAAAATYIPNLFMVACVAWIAGLDFVNGRTSRGLVLFLTMLALSMVVGYLSTKNVVQVVFGLWVFTPILFGLACAPVLLQSNKWTLPLLTAIFIVAAGGVVAHNFVAYPWVGVSYSVGGVELEGAREWQTTGGAQRLSGFARSSFDVAGQILVSASLLALQLRSGAVRLVLWILATAAISMSTSKGILLALAMAALATEAIVRREPQVLRGVLSLGILWLFVPPILGWTMDWSQAARTDIDNPLYGSFLDRMNDMWPRAWELAFELGLPPLGRGIGGIGVPVSMFEPALANAGDNIFVYCLVILGVLALPLFALGFVALFRLCACLADDAVRPAMVMAVVVIWYGGVSNILEHAVLAFCFGLVCRVLVARLSGIGPGWRSTKLDPFHRSGVVIGTTSRKSPDIW